MLEYFRIHSDVAEALAMLDMEARGRLFTAICEYAFYGKASVDMTGAERIAWPLVRSQIERSGEKKDRRSVTSANNGRSGGRPKKANSKSEPKPIEKAPETYRAESAENLTDIGENLTAASELNRTELNGTELNRTELKEEDARARATPATATDDLVAYAASEITVMTPTAVQELETYSADLGEELTRHAIEEALSNGVRSWAYVRSILQRYQRSGYRTVAEAKAGRESRAGGRAQANPALDYTQREYSAEYFDNLYEDLSGIADEQND